MFRRLLFFLFLLSVVFSTQAQKALPVVLANSNATYFLEGKNGDRTDWSLDADIELDVFNMEKYSKAREISFHTDRSSLEVKLRPGEQYDFVVLLNGTDSCFQRIRFPAPIRQYKALRPATRDTIPFELTAANNIKVKVVLNQVDTLDMHFDTGASGIVITHESIANRTHLLANEKAGFKTATYATLSTKSTLQIGNLTWENREIYPVDVSPKGTDGHFGWNLFNGRVVEIDYDQGILIVHSSLDEIPKTYTKLPLEYTHTIFCITGKLVARGKKYKGRFLFDTGYQRAVLLDSELAKEQQFPKDLPVIKSTTLRNSAGQSFEVKIVNSDRLILGKYSGPNVPTQLLNTANPARFKTHILGNEFLKRFNIILDFQNNFVYLTPNKLMEVDYIDAS